MRALPTRTAAALLCLAATAPTQAILSEIDFADQWIEIHNTDAANPVDLTTWSIYYATTTLGQAGTYWFGFPEDTTIAPSGYLRVNWRAAIGVMSPVEFNTGSSIFNFLFGFFPETLITAPQGGGTTFAAALGLFNTQNNLAMNDPTVIQDWVTWGDAGSLARPAREDLAIQNGKWTAGATIATPPTDESIALILAQNTEPTPISAFFRDESPTPVDPNDPTAAHNTLGADFVQLPNSTTCVFAPSQAPSLPPPAAQAISISAAGNIDFGLRVINTDPAQIGVLLFGSAAGAGSPLILGCPIWVGGTLLAVPFAPQSGTTDLSAPLVGFTNTTVIDVYLQPLTVEVGGTDPVISFGAGYLLSVGL